MISMKKPLKIFWSFALVLTTGLAAESPGFPVMHELAPAREELLPPEPFDDTGSAETWSLKPQTSRKSDKDAAKDENKTIIDFQKIVHPLDMVNGGSYTNHSPFVTWVKGEKSERVYPILPGVTYPWSIDGFTDPVTRPGYVYKVIDGLHTFYNVIDGKPEIDFSPDDTVSIKPAHRILQSFSGGWKDAEWHAKIRSATDFGWDNLFEVSQLTMATNL